jgi:phospholipid/cholesterol/gamma-HCH transport system substrate-binding protein
MKKYSMETAVGIFMLIGLICMGYLTVKLGKLSILGDNSYAVFARFNSISGLRIGSPVEMLGIEIGRVDSFTMDQNDQLAIVEMKIKKGIKIYGDAIASIKTSGLIGDKYISIDAGGAEKILEPGETITNTESAIDIESLISKYAFGNVKD